LERAKVDLPNAEDYVKYVASSATLTSFSFDQQYAIVDISSLLEALVTIREPCTQCHKGAMIISDYRLQGHGLEISFQCAECLFEWKWTGSQQYPDGSLKVNRDMVVAWKVVGAERGKYFKFTEALRCGQYNRTSWDKTVELLQPIVHNMVMESYQEGVAFANEATDGAIIGCDVQHSRSQRVVGAAPFAGSVFMLHNKGPFYSRIVWQQLVNNQMLIQAGKLKTASKDKHATHIGLQHLAQQLNRIDGGVCDGSSSANKSWRELIYSNSKFNKPLLNNCFWHKAKSIPAKFNKDLVEKKISLPTNQQKGRKKTTTQYPQFKEFEITGKRIKSAFYRAQRLHPGDEDAIREEFIGAAEFYQNFYVNSLSQETMEALTTWLENFSEDLSKYSKGLLTEESFHRVVLKYWKKGNNAQFEEYQLARELAVLDWNENAGQSKKTRTAYFRKKITDQFSDMMRTK
jgi:hypothetical protein